MAAGGAVRALVVAGFVCWYSTGVFKAMDSHFGSHFGQFLRKQIRSNEQMRKDLEADRGAMERIVQAKGKELPVVKDEQSLLEGLMQRFRGAVAEAPDQRGEGRRRACPENPRLETLLQDPDKHGLLVPLEEACAAQDCDVDIDVDKDSCPAPAATGPPVCAAPPPGA